MTSSKPSSKASEARLPWFFSTYTREGFFDYSTVAFENFSRIDAKWLGVAFIHPDP